MPNEIDRFGRYKVYLRSRFNEEEWQESKRLKVQTFRRSAKGLGAATLKIMSKYATEGDFAQLANIVNNTSYAVFRNGLIKSGTFISIVDVTLDNSVFIGTIDRVSYSVSEEGTKRSQTITDRDEEGSVFANEIGWHFSNLVLSTQVEKTNTGLIEYTSRWMNVSGKPLLEPPAFNPTVEGRVAGNKGTGLKFITDSSELVYTNDQNEWEEADLEKVWSRKDVLNCLVNDFVTQYGATIKIAWPTYESSQEFKYFTDVFTPQGWPSFHNENLTKIIDELVEDPLSWYITYDQSSSGEEITIVIYNKSVTDLKNSAGDIIIPAASRSSTTYIEQIKLAALLGPNAAFNIAETEQRVDKVTVRGERILCGGTLQYGVGFTANWSSDGTYNEAKSYVEGSSEGPLLDQTRISEVEQYRNNFENIYQRFKFAFNENNYAIRHVDVTKGLVGDYQDPTSNNFFAFCPRFDFYEINDTSFLVEPKTEITVADSVSKALNTEEPNENHSTPNPLQMKFSKNFPKYGNFKIYDGPSSGQTKRVDFQPLPPQIWTRSVDLFNKPRWIELISSANQPSRIEFKSDGFLIRSPIRNIYDGTKEYLEEAWKDADYINGEVSNAIESHWITYGPGIVSSNDYSPLSNTRPGIGFASHYGLFCVSLGIYSDQRLEISRTRKEYINYDNTDEAPIIREHVIEDNDLQLWFVHRGSLIKPDTDGIEPYRTQADEFTRNDYPLAKSILDNAFSWMSVDKNSINLAFQLSSVDLNSIEPDPEIIAWNKILTLGNFVNKVVQKNDSEYYANTTIETISVDAESGIVELTTALPQMPAMRRIASTNTSANVPSLYGSVDRRGTISKNVKSKPEAPEQFTVGETYQNIISGGEDGGSTIMVAKILGGNSPKFGDDAEGNPIYSANTSMSLPMPTYNEDGNIILNPSVADWTNLDLSDDYAIGDPLPICPEGVCYLQLARPYSLGTSSWDANIEGGFEPENADDFLCNRVYFNEDNKTLLCTFTQSGIKAKDGFGPNDISIKVSRLDGKSVGVQPAINSVSITEDNKVAAVLNRPLDPDNEICNVSFGAIVYKLFESEDENVSNRVFNDALTSTVAGYLGDKFTTVFGLNKNGTQIFHAGQLVLINATEVTIIDKSNASNTRIVYSIIGPCSSAQYHNHSGYTQSGLGPAILNIDGVD